MPWLGANNRSLSRPTNAFSDGFAYNENPMTSQGGVYQISPSDWNTPKVVSGFGATCAVGNSNDYKFF
jgi:hypothetical protein